MNMIPKVSRLPSLDPALSQIVVTHISESHSPFALLPHDLRRSAINVVLWRIEGRRTPSSVLLIYVLSCILDAAAMFDGLAPRLQKCLFTLSHPDSNTITKCTEPIPSAFFSPRKSVDAKHKVSIK